MYITAVFLGYLLAIILGMANLALIFLLSKKEPILVKTKLYRSITGFVIGMFLLATDYFILYYQEKVFRQFDFALGFRIADCLSLLLVIFFWIRTMVYLFYDHERKGILTAGLILVAARFLVVCPVMVLFTNGSYVIENAAARQFFLYAEGILAGLTTILFIKLMMDAVLEIAIGLRRYYLMGVSLLLITFDIWNFKTEVGLHWGKYGVSPWESERFDPFGLILCLVGVLTCVFIYICDFSPRFIKDTPKEDAESTISKTCTEQETLDIIAHKHQFTVREREVLGLVYQGMTNPDIADQMCISRNTVKVHLHNIYEKLDVSNRMELIHLVYSQNKPLG